MTFHKPTLIIKRVIAAKEGNFVYDERFHSGLNIIRGQNGSGKTTITQLIAFGLGREVAALKPEILLCDYVYLEISINNSPYTLRRELESTARRPLDIFEGGSEQALTADISSWKRFPFNGTSDRESFSQVLFDIMGMPQTKGASSKLTMNQILRVCYAEQSNPASAIFTLEQFDSALTREATFSLLTGLYNDDLYADQIKRDELDKQLQKTSDQLTAIYKVLAQSGFTHLNQRSFDDALSELADREKSISDEISQILDNSYASQESSDNDPQISKKYRNLEPIREELVAAYERRNDLILNIEDSELFISDLENRLAALEDAKNAKIALDHFSFEYCPACLSPVSKELNNQHACSLCKTEIDEKRISNNYLRMTNEIKFQVIESKKILSRNKDKADHYNQEIRRLESQLYEAESEIRLYKKHFFSKSDDQLKRCFEELGFIRESINSLRKQEDLFKVVETLRLEKTRLEGDLSDVKDRVEREKSLLERRHSDVNAIIYSSLEQLLNADLDREEEFRSVESLEFSPAHNTVYVNGRNSFAESSLVYLNTAFHLALLKSSCETDFMRFPRFLLLDGIENGGMESGRSRHLQLLIAQLSEEMEVEHQIIITTANIDMDLEKEKFTVGRFYTRDDKSLRFKKATDSQGQE